MGKKFYGKRPQRSQQQPTAEVSQPQALVVNESNKYVLGGYFSLGLSNFFKTVLLVFTKAGIKVVSDRGNIVYAEEKIGQVLNTLYKATLSPRPPFEDHEQAWLANFRLNANQQAKLRRLLFHHFPFLGPIMADEAAYKVNRSKKSNVTDAYTMTYGTTLSDCLKTLSIIAQGLVDCRNTDVHYDPYSSIDDLARQYLVQEDVVRYLLKTLVASRRLDKQRNSIETEKMEFLTGYAKDANDDAGRSLEAYIRRWGFYPKYDQVVKTDADGNPLYVPLTDKKGNPRFDRDGNPLYKQKLDRQRRPVFQNGQPVYEVQVKMVERNDFFYRIGGETTVQKDGKTYTMLTGFGLAFFCTLFLTKPQARQMLSDIRLFERSPYPQELNDIIRDMLSIYRIRSPRGKKLEGGDNKVLLALDMLNELRKCPRELYDVLTPDGQKFFEDEVKHPNERTPEVVKRLRSTDRFPHLAMRYIDETQLFDNIRFQVQLGKLRFRFYVKDCINGEKDTRSWQKDINGFGRLHEVEQQRQAQYEALLQQGRQKSVKIEGEDLNLDLLQLEPDTPGSHPYITDSRAAYRVHNNRIGLYWNELTVADREGHERIIVRPGDYLPSLDGVQDGQAPVTMHAPMAMLSVHELPALVFYGSLLRTYGVTDEALQPECIIIGKCQALRRFFTDVSNGTLLPVAGKRDLRQLLQQPPYGLALNEIPREMLDYLTGKAQRTPADERKRRLTEERLKKMLRRALRRRDGYRDDRKKIGDKDNKYGKDSFVDVRHGSLARYLSESFLEWQPSNEGGTNKLTGLNFSKLQSELAVFDSADKQPAIKAMLERAGLLDGDYAHPFLAKVVAENIRNIEELYLVYLSAEVDHLKTLFGIEKVNDERIDFDRLTLASPDYAQLPFVKGKARWEQRTDDSCRRLARRYLEVDGRRAPLWLPDGLFTEHILNVLKTHCADNALLQEHLADDELTAFASYMIRVFFEDQRHDHSQPFYTSSRQLDADEEPVVGRFAHVYDLFNILNNRKERNAYVKVPMTVEQINRELTANASDGFGGWIELMGPNRKVLRDAQQNIRYKKDITVRIEERVAAMTNREQGNHKTLDEAREAMQRKLTRMVHEVKDNERAIRRCKAQDMVLFLMAERLMEESEATGGVSRSEKFKLENVCHKDFLSQTVNFDFPYDADGDTVHITQELISLKNLGEFYQLLSDDRLPSLLKKLAQAKKAEGQTLTVSYSSLMGELASYDIHRSRIFRAVHQLEKFVVSRDGFRAFLDNPDDDRFYIGNDKTRDPKRNNFRELLYLLETTDEDVLSSDGKELLIAIRNAFSHNHYKVDFGEEANLQMMKRSVLMRGEAAQGADAAKLTTLATLIAQRMEELQRLVCEGLR